MRKICVQTFLSPAGEMILGSIDNKICLCDWLFQPHRQRTDRLLCKRLNAEYVDEDSMAVTYLIKQLKQYFCEERTEFDIPLEFAGTPFQQSVWKALLDIPYGTFIPYAIIAEIIGKPKAVRAVANAVAANPMSIIVPCHRVIGTDGTLTGYAGGLKAKEMLLDLEYGMGLNFKGFW